MKIRENSSWSLVIPTSMGIRITPVDRQPVHASQHFTMTATSAESNVGSVASFLGLPVKILTGFVRESPIAEFIRGNLRQRNIMYEGPEIEQGSPWGYRHQINIADSGFGGRGPRVYNDRAGEVGRELTADDFDLERILAGEGAAIVHISGLFAALSPGTGDFCLSLARKAREAGTRISFDLNYRASFWKGRQSELRRLFTDIAALSDILIGNEEDFQLSLGIPGPEAGGAELGTKIEHFKAMIGKARCAFPGTSVFATTLREVLDANRHKWGALLFAEEKWYLAEPREIGVLDRIGGGDGFVGGLLYGVLRGWEPEKCLQFGWATGAMAVTMLTDYAQPLNEQQVWSIWEGNARVVR